MADESSAGNTSALLSERVHQTIKWTVYALLTVNFGYYGYEDFTIAQHTLNENYTFIELTQAFAASIDDFAWIMLIGLFEYETYWDESEDHGPLHKVLPMLRMGCYAMILNTTWSYGQAVYEISLATPLALETQVCDLVGLDFSFTRNIGYTDITAENCESFSEGGQLTQLFNANVVTDASGWEEFTRLSWVDSFENLSWLLIVAMLEMKLQLQNRGSYKGRMFSISSGVEKGAYGLIILFSIWWASKGHYIYAWDEFLWIAGFRVIEMNLSEWREDLQEEAEEGVAT